MLKGMAIPRKVILIGFMGSGKSTVAAVLGRKLGLTVYEMDDLIVELSGLDSIPAIFAAKGEAYFRELEARVAHSLRERENVVISTGGGVISRPANMQNLTSAGGVVVYLRTSFEILAERIGDISGRPLFADGAKARALYLEREPVYQSYATITVDTDSLGVDEVCARVLSRLES